MSDNVIDILNLSYTYPGRGAPSLSDVTLSVRPGEFVLISGPTGCGKSTLLRAMNGIIPHDSGGALAGDARVLGRSTREAPFAWLASHAGLVFQSPEDQLFASRPADEVAFGLENLCLAPAEIANRVTWALEATGLIENGDSPLNRKGGTVPIFDRPVAELSGGQKQRLAVASVIAMRPSALLLDEPLSQLDPAGAEQVLDLLCRLRRELGIAVVLVEHRMHNVAPVADRVVLMDAGRIVLDAPASRAFDDLAIYERLGLRVPETVELMQRLGRPERPLDVAAAVSVLRGAGDVGALPEGPAGERGGKNHSGDTIPNASSFPVVDLRGLAARYSRRGPDALVDVDLRIDEGEAVAVMGANGSGKSTLLYALLGELRASAGSGAVLGEEISVRARRGRPGDVAMLLQNPDLMLLTDRVDEEIAAGPRNLGLDAVEVRRRVVETMDALGVADLAAEPPLALSRGQRLRVALGSVLSLKPRLLLLDEPTTGQDRLQIESMMDHLAAQRGGRALVFCTHDVMTAARYADRVLVLSGGRIAACGTPREVFADAEAMSRAGLRAPVAAELARALGRPAAVSVDDLARMLSPGGRP